MKIGFSTEDEAFRVEVATARRAPARRVRQAALSRRTGDEHAFPEERKAWEREMAKGGWIGLLPGASADASCRSASR